MNKCPNCEYHKESARIWRQEAYKLSGHPLNDEQEQGASMTDNFAKEMLSVSEMKGSFEYTITNISPPKPVGYWVISDGFQIAIFKKPTDEHIKNHYEMLGWKWRDAA